MKLRETLTAVLAVAAIDMMSDSAMAKTVDIKNHPAQDVKAGCGGTYFAPGKGGVYACVYNDGHGIICGGKGKDPSSHQDYSQTCDVFMKAPPCLPTREAIRKAEEAEQTQGSEKK